MKKSNLYKTRAAAYIIFAALFVMMGIGLMLLRVTNNKQPIKEKEATVKSEPEVVSEKKEKIQIKDSAYIEVPYTVQAPNQRWDIHDESCEEAAALMYHEFLIGSKLLDIPANKAHEEFIKMVNWQKTLYGKEPDLSIKVFGEFIKSYYGHDATIVNNATKEDIKIALSAGNPVIVPVMTHSLGNPNYGRENSYHVLLIKGYDADGVITNDAGISKGKNYRYDWGVLFSAIDAQTPKMDQGRSMIFFIKDQ